MFFQTSKRTTAIGHHIVRDALQELGLQGLAENDFSLTLPAHDRNGEVVPQGFAHRGDVMFYPCSIIKIFYLVAAQAALEAGQPMPSCLAPCTMRRAAPIAGFARTNISGPAPRPAPARASAASSQTCWTIPGRPSILNAGTGCRHARRRATSTG